MGPLPYLQGEAREQEALPWPKEPSWTLLVQDSLHFDLILTVLFPNAPLPDILTFCIQGLTSEPLLTRVSIWNALLQRQPVDILLIL